jgi:hypothetical protein
VVIASKFTSDIFYANSRYAKVGGIPLLELNQLELELLFLIDFQLHITLEDLQEYADQLLSHAMSLTPPSLEPETHTYKINVTTSPTINHTTHKPVVLPLTPPYTSTIDRKPSHPHPYKRPDKKKRLGLVSPKD